MLSGYEYRPEQLTLAHEVARAFDERRMLVAEAGTGTGKTLAYLVPAVLSGRRVVVSTATKNLQDQLFHKDLPLLRDRLGLDVSATLVKGRANYLCLHRLERARTGALLASREEAEAFSLLLGWAERTATGDRAELHAPRGVRRLAAGLHRPRGMPRDALPAARGLLRHPAAQAGRGLASWWW